MKTFSTSLICLASLVAAGAVCAESNVTLYGVMDAGVSVVKGKGSDTLVQALNNGDAVSRWGLKGKEDIGNGNFVSFVLEQGIKPMTGQEATTGVLFDRDSILTVGGNWGQFSFGRTGSLMGTTGTYGMWTNMGANPLAANFLDSQMLGSFVGSGQINNAVTYQGKPWDFLTVTLQYSNGIANDTEKWSKNDHLYGASVFYKKDDLNAGLIFTLTQYESDGTYNAANSNSTKNIFLTLSKNFGATRVYFDYQHVWDSRNLGGATNAFYAKDLGFGTTAQLADSKKGFRSDSFAIGANTPLWGGKIYAALKWNIAKWQGDSYKEGADRDGNRWVASLKYSYPFSKRTHLYTILNYAKGYGMFKCYEERATRLTWGMGLNHHF